MFYLLSLWGAGLCIQGASEWAPVGGGQRGIYASRWWIVLAVHTLALKLPLRMGWHLPGHRSLQAEA